MKGWYSIFLYHIGKTSMINNETVGISAEVAIAREFGLEIDSYYEQRSDQEIVNRIQPLVKQAFARYNIPAPVKHVAEGQNPIDFNLSGGKTLSVKTNQESLGKVAPQTIGQPTSFTYFTIMGQELNCNLLDGLNDPEVNMDRKTLFKKITMTRTKDVMDVYWKHMFDCDYLIHFYDVLNRSVPNYVVFGKAAVPNWSNGDFSFSQSLRSWNESCTLYYKGYSIGEFQVHNNRDCFKFRFNMDNLRSALS